MTASAMMNRHLQFQRISAAATRRPSAPNTLNVRQAAAVSITSKPTPVRMISVMRLVGGNSCEVPVPHKMTSGALSRAAEKSAMLISAIGGGAQSGKISWSVRMTEPVRTSLFTRNSPLVYERTKTPWLLSRLSCTQRSRVIDIEAHPTRAHSSVPSVLQEVVR